MRLIKLEAENVFSLGHVVLPLANRKLLLITGFSNDDKSGNGAGKSSLANHAIVWGLFGQTYDGTRGDAVINRNSDKKFGKVEITFEDINGRHCKVIRTRNPNSLKLITYSIPDTTYCRLEKETQEQINRLIGRDFSTFIHSDLIGPGTERSFFRLSGAEQVSVIENLLPVNDLEDWANKAKTRAKITLEQIQKFKFARAETIGKVQAIKEHLQTMDNQRVMWEANRIANISKARSSLNKVQDEQLKIKHMLHIVGADWSDHWDTKLKDSIYLNSMKAGLATEIDYLEKIIKTDSCKACRQPVNDVAKKDASERLAIETIRYNEFSFKYQEVSIWLDWVNQLNAIMSRKSQIEQIQTNIKNLQDADNPYNLESCEQRINLYEVEISAADSMIETLTTELRWLEFWANAYGKDIRTMMIEEICPFLEARINEYLIKLNNSQFKATVSTVKSLKSGDIREKFNLEIKSDHGASSFDLLSVGEKQIVSFAASLAVADLATSQVSGRSNVLILDEPFMGLHKNNCDNIINFLNGCDVETILLISNEESLKELVPNRVHVVKTKGQSWLE